MGTTSEPSDAPAVCALPGCQNAVEQISQGQARLYCCVAHRKIARRARRNELERLSRKSPARQPVAPDAGAPAAGGAASSHPDDVAPRSYLLAGTRPRSAPPSVPIPKAPRPYLVPAPLPGRFRHSKFVPHAARGVRPARRRSPDPSPWEWPQPPQPPQPPQSPWEPQPAQTPEPSLPPPPQPPQPQSQSQSQSQSRQTRQLSPQPAPQPAPQLSPQPAPQPTPAGLRPPHERAHQSHPSALARLPEALARLPEAVVRLPEAVVRATAWFTGVLAGWRARLQRRRGEARRNQAEALRARRDAAAVLLGTPLPTDTDTDTDRATAPSRGAERPRERVARLVGLLAVWSPRMREALSAALDSLLSNRLRSLLTGVGIVFGIAAVIVLVALGNGMKQDFNARFSKLANQITITPAKGTVPSGSMPRNLTDRDVAALHDPQRAPDITAISPAVLGNLTVTAGQNMEKANLIGASENYLELLDRHLVAGTWFSGQQINRSERGVVIGQQALNLLWGPDVPPAQVLGQEVRLAHSTFKVQGVLAPDGQEDNAVIVPLDAARAYLVGNNGGKLDMVILKSTSVDTVGRAAAEATEILDKQHLIKVATDRDFNVRTFTELLQQSADTISFLTMFIIAVAALSLLIGGIGIANIMLVSVTERTREIGIRKAVGANRAAIMRQFMSEAVMLTGTGGITGIILGVGLTFAAIAIIPTVSSSIPVPIMTVGPVIVAFVVSLTIGVLAGSYPAYRAARLRPIQALRFE